MGMTEQQREIAGSLWFTLDTNSKSGFISAVEAVIAALPKPEPVGRGWLDPISGKLVCAAPDGSTLLYAEAPIATPVVEQTNAAHEDTERLNYLIKSGRIVLEVNGEYFTYNHTSGRSGSAKETPRAAIDASMDEKGGA